MGVYTVVFSIVYSVVKYLDYIYQFFLRRQICMNDLIYMYLASGLYDKQLSNLLIIYPISGKCVLVLLKCDITSYRTACIHHTS